jgi:hypothetical protein
VFNEGGQLMTHPIIKIMGFLALGLVLSGCGYNTLQATDE